MALIRLTLAQKAPAAQLLARAFQDDPLMRFAMPDDAKRAPRLLWLVDTFVHYCVLYGEAYATPQLEGVACWLPPGQTALTFGRLWRTGMLALGRKLGVAATGRFLATTRYTEKVHKAVMPAPHWYLWVISVDPACQGRGLGGSLLQPVLERATSSGVPCYLETHSPKNVAFYKKHGFDVAHQGVIPNRGLSVWAMVKQP